MFFDHGSSLVYKMTCQVVKITSRWPQGLKGSHFLLLSGGSMGEGKGTPIFWCALMGRQSTFFVFGMARVAHATFPLVQNVRLQSKFATTYQKAGFGTPQKRPIPCHKTRESMASLSKTSQLRTIHGFPLPGNQEVMFVSLLFFLQKTTPPPLPPPLPPVSPSEPPPHNEPNPGLRPLRWRSSTCSARSSSASARPDVRFGCLVSLGQCGRVFRGVSFL